MRTAVVIDDEPVLRAMLARHLENEGWRVLEADNGDAGLDLVNTHRPDAVLCDLLMPGTNGFKVCRTIRSRRDELAVEYVGDARWVHVESAQRGHAVRLAAQKPGAEPRCVLVADVRDLNIGVERFATLRALT